jgi:uridine monophosphate synthetase
MSTGFFDRLQARSEAVDSLLCIGLDPHIKELGADASAEGAYRFCKRLIDATSSYAAAFKPNAAFFECFGAEGVAQLARVIAAVPDGIPVVLDVKRGDIATTAEAYADASYKALGADSVTVNGYMGVDSVAPFTGDASKGVFVLCKTSNPSSNELQTLKLAASGEALYETVARLATTTWNGNGNVGLVVGATDSEALRAVRAIAPRAWILAPGVGFQGGDLGAALAAGLTASGTGLLLPVSRGVSKAADPAAAARELRDQINVGRAAFLAKQAEAAAMPALPAAARAFFAAALAAGVLRFGSFTLKSGRVSPYFFNAGNFRTGSALAALGDTYARTILDVPAGTLDFDVLFGPAYKGIPLVTAAGVSLSRMGRDVPVAYNRKEAKDHGEGGTMVGADVAGKRVLIVDDVISAGTAVGEAIAIIKAAGGVPAGVVIGLDRQERGGDGTTMSAVQSVTATYGIPVIAVAGLRDLIAYVTEAAAAAGGKITAPGLEGVELPALLDSVRTYRAQYGVEQ